MKWSDATRRCSAKAAHLRVFVNALREALGYDELYPTGGRTDAERFYVPVANVSDGHVSMRRSDG